MHQSSFDKMQRFKDRHLAPRAEEPLRILDVGSQDVNGSYRPIFASPRWQYVGADQAAGKNVDVVLADPHHWRELEDESFDVVISGQALEHMALFWVGILEIARVLKGGGLCCLIAPASGPEHRYPLDCWRFYPDGFRALAQWAHLEILEASTQWESQGYTDGSDAWKDTLLVCRKPDRGKWGGFVHGAKMAVLRRVLQRAARSVRVLGDGP